MVTFAGCFPPRAGVRLPPKDVFSARDLMPALKFRILDEAGANMDISVL